MQNPTQLAELQNKILQYKAELNEKDSEIARLNTDLKFFQESNLKYAEKLESTLAALETKSKKISELEAKTKERVKELCVEDDQINFSIKEKNEEISKLKTSNEQTNEIHGKIFEFPQNHI